MSVLGEQLRKRFDCPKMYIMIGNIGSGKSTYISSYLPEAALVSKDKLRYTLGSGTYIFEPKLEPFVHNVSVYMALEYCRNQMKKVVIDETNMKRKSRATFVRIGQKYDYEIIAIVFPVLPKDVSTARRMTNPHSQPDKNVWEEVWEKFNRCYQEPTLEEGFDTIIKVKKEDII
jgi:predicted kinase